MALSLSSSATITLLILLGLTISHLSTQVLAKNRLNAGESLDTQSSLTYDQYSLTLLKDDCNLVFKHEEQLIWESRTSTFGVFFCSLDMQDDGNLAIHGVIAGIGFMIWSSDTIQQNSSNKNYLMITDKVAIYNNQDKPIWINGSKVF